MEVQGLLGNPSMQGLGAMSPRAHRKPRHYRLQVRSRSPPGLGTLPKRVAHVTADVIGLRAGPNRAPCPNIAERGRATRVSGRVWPTPRPGRGEKTRTPRCS